VVVAVLLAGGRWISHVPIGPVYISDVLLGAAMAHAIFSRLLARKGRPRGPGPGILVAAVLFAILVRLLFAHGDARLVARDAAPFAYIAIAYFSAGAYAHMREQDRDRTAKWLHGALVLHLVLVALSIYVPGLTQILPQLPDGTRLLEIRPDFDTALLGVLIGLSILRVRRTGYFVNASLAVSSFALVITMQSRAGFLACCACILVALVIRAGNRRLACALLVATTVLALGALLPSITAGQRLLATVGVSAASYEVEANAQGTTRGRLIAWERVVDYTLEDDVRMAVGVGFGTDFLRLAGADVPLGKTLELRAPHNYLLTAFARFGIIGLTVVAALLFHVLAVAVRVAWRGQPDTLSSVCVFLVISIFVIAMCGVVLESPFGAVPFFWAVGVLLGRERQRRSSVGGCRSDGRVNDVRMPVGAAAERAESAPVVPGPVRWSGVSTATR
jgi:hypothetical protein